MDFDHLPIEIVEKFVTTLRSPADQENIMNVSRRMRAIVKAIFRPYSKIIFDEAQGKIACVSSPEVRRIDYEIGNDGDLNFQALVNLCTNIDSLDFIVNLRPRPKSHDVTAILDGYISRDWHGWQWLKSLNIYVDLYESFGRYLDSNHFVQAFFYRMRIDWARRSCATVVHLRYACADEHTRVQILRAVAAENHGDLGNVSIIDDAVITLKAGQLTINYRIDVDASFST